MCLGDVKRRALRLTLDTIVGQEVVESPVPFRPRPPSSVRGSLRSLPHSDFRLLPNSRTAVTKRYSGWEMTCDLRRLIFDLRCTQMQPSTGNRKSKIKRQKSNVKKAIRLRPDNDGRGCVRCTDTAGTFECTLYEAVRA